MAQKYEKKRYADKKINFFMNFFHKNLNYRHKYNELFWMYELYEIEFWCKKSKKS